MNIIILGDKYQKGMKSRGCPALIKISKTSNILQQQYKILHSLFPGSKIIYVSGFEHKKIQNFLIHNKLPITLLYNDKYEEYNDTYSLSLASEYLNTKTIIIFGYHILQKKIFHKFHSGDESQIFVSNKSTTNSVGCTIDNNKILNISFDLPHVLNNIYYLTKKDVEKLREYVQNFNFRNYFLFEIMNKLIDNKIIFKTFFSHNGTNHET